MSLKQKRIVDPVLTNLARGYTNSSHVGINLAPVVMVNKEGGKIPQFSKDSFKIYNTERAIRATSNRINPEDKSSLDFVLTEHDLEFPIDYREAEEDVFNIRQHATKVVTDGVSLRLEKLIADTAQNTSTYSSGNKVTLSSSDKFDEPTSSPVDIFETAKEAVRSKIAAFPNTVIFGAKAFAKLKEHPKIIDRIEYTSSAVVTVDLLKQLLNIDNIFVGSAVYANNSGNFVDIWSDNVVLAYVPPKSVNMSRSMYEPAFAYTLRKKNNPFIDTYNEKGKVEIVRNTDLFNVNFVGVEAGYLISDTNS